MSTVKMDTKIYIEPKLFDSKIKEHIFCKLREKTLLTCVDGLGYVMDVSKINTIKNVHSNLFIVNHESTLFKPEKDTVYNGIVRMICKEGIFAEINDIQKVLVPTSFIYDTYEYNDNMFICKKNTNKTIDVNVELKIKLTTIKYYNTKFNCIGQIV